MSDLMLHGVLNMSLPDDPKELEAFEWLQFRDRARQASARIHELEGNLHDRTNRVFSSFFVGGLVGVAITFIAAAPVVLFQPSLPLVAFACEAIGLEGAVNLDNELICVQDAMPHDDVLGQVLDRLQAGLDRAALKQEGGE